MSVTVVAEQAWVCDNRSGSGDVTSVTRSLTPTHVLISQEASKL